jgi:hypothetical protein
MTNARSFKAPRITGLLSALALCAGVAGMPTQAHAQDYTAMINQSMAQMNAMIANGQQRVDGMVRQKMQDPRVQAGYRQYQANMYRQGMQAQDYYTWTYNYIYTNGYSAAGMAQARANENANQAKVQSAWQGLRQAEDQRGQAQATWQQHYSNNQNEAGNLLRGNSTYTAPNGATQVLPHTWAANTYQQYQGRQYYVDYSGQYHVLGTDGYWYPLAAR